MRWMKLEPIMQSEVSQKDKDQYSIDVLKMHHLAIKVVLVLLKNSVYCSSSKPFEYQ